MKFWLLAIAACDAASRIDPVSYNHEPEAHHSLHPPLDKSQVYWNFGGSTVVTRKLMRLTPDTQDRRGWIWNEYPIESENWELEFHFEVFSKPHFGGDGFAFWVMGGDQDPTFSTEPDFLNGPIFGMKKDFQGFGVAFDVYDNDNKRNNPSIFVLENIKGNVLTLNHDNDYEDDMVKSVPDVVPGHASDDTNAYKSFKCVADFRNTGKPSKALIKYLHKVLHVYIDTQEGQGYKFCLAVTLNSSFIDHHFAFTAATGQVADTHDIKEVTVRYLADSDKEFDDTLLAHFEGQGGRRGTWSSFFFSICVCVGSGLLAFAGHQLYLARQITGARIDLVRVCKQTNEHVVIHWAVHFGVMLVLLFCFQWVALLLNLPVLVFRIYLFFSGQLRFSESSFTGEGAKGHAASGLSARTRLVLDVVFYGVIEIFYLYRFLKG